MAAPKLYTVEQAEKTLPLVGRIVRDLVGNFKDREQLLVERRRLGLRPSPNSKAADKAHLLEREIHQVEQNLMRYQAELIDLGIEIKDFERGLVDFYSRYEDRTVYLCWSLGEGGRIGFWHDVDAGFAGRQPITDTIRQKFLGPPGAKPGHQTAKQQG